MTEMDIEARSIDEAIEKACSEFRVPREKLNIEIISEGAAGFLGIGSRKAQIKASLLNFDLSIEPASPRPRPSVSAPAMEAKTPAPQPPAPFEGSTESRETKSQPPQNAPSIEGGPPAEKAKELLSGILVRMEMESPVTMTETDDAIRLTIQGDGSGLLIGKRGQNLDAIQYIVNKATHHATNSRKTIIIDTEDYRKRREESLVALAMRLGEKVKITNKPVTVGHMNAHDRRIVHLAMQNDATLTTKSRGEGEYRKIVILPARREPDQADT